jgi:hypothetical protein
MAKMPPLTFSDEPTKIGLTLTRAHISVHHTTLASLAIGLNNSYVSTSPICFLTTFTMPCNKSKQNTNVPTPALPLITIHISQSVVPFGLFHTQVTCITYAWPMTFSY